LNNVQTENLSSLHGIILHPQGNSSTVGSCFAIRFTTIHFYDPCRVGLSIPYLWCITVATQASFLYLVRF